MAAPSELLAARVQKIDPRMKCRCCLRWMRYKPTEKTPAQRRLPPSANVCTDCRPADGAPVRPDFMSLSVPLCARRRCPDAVERLGNLVRP